jgi:hypothetical protein
LRALESLGEKYEREKRELVIRMEREKEEIVKREEMRYDNKIK